MSERTDDDHKLSLAMTSDPAEIASARKALERFAAARGLEPEDVAELGLATNEAIANIIRHAYKGRDDGRIELTVEIEGEDVVVLLRDWGSGAVPNLARQKTDLLQPGGLGLACMKLMMDQLQFVPQPDGMLLKMIKRKR